LKKVLKTPSKAILVY